MRTKTKPKAKANKKNKTIPTKYTKTCYYFKDHHNHHHQQNDKYDKYNYTLNPGPTTIHIPLANGATSSPTANLKASVTQDVQRTTIWQQVNKDGTSADQLIIPTTVKVRQINGSQK